MNIKSQHYQVAYRKVNKSFADFPLENKESAFLLIPNSCRYWAADPFLFEEKGCIYVFAELFDFVLRRGVIGYSKWDKDHFTKWKPIIKENFHMSYPLIFKHKDSIYMLPETYQSGELMLYKATEFPEKWVKYKTLKSECSLVDTTIASVSSGGYIGYSFSDLDKTVWKLRLDDNLDITDFSLVENVDSSLQRNAGNMLIGRDKIIRPCQDCKKEYGFTIIFRKLDKATLKEQSSLRIEHKDICVKDRKGKDYPIYGMHTYNCTDGFEVIDLKQKESVHYIEFFLRILNKFRKGS